MGHATRVDPGQHLPRIADSGQCAPRLLLHDLIEEGLWKAEFHIGEGLELGQLHAEPGPSDGEALLVGEFGIPPTDLLYPAGDGAIEAVETTVPEVVFHLEDIEHLVPGVKVHRRHTAEHGRAQTIAQ